MVLANQHADATHALYLQYNGCKWKGQKLRVELAKPHYTLKLQQEWQEQQQQEAEAQAAEQQGPATPAYSVATTSGAEDGVTATIRITVPGTRKVSDSSRRADRCS